MTLLCLAFMLAGFVLFGLSMTAHHQQRLGAKPTPRRQKRMRAGAWACLALAFPPAIAAQGWTFGPILWCGLLMLGAALVFLGLNFLPSRIRA